MANRVSTRLTAAQGRRFGLTLGTAFAALGGLLWWRGRPTIAIIAWSLSVSLFLAALLVPRQLEVVERVWMGLARQISRVTTPVLMAVVYFLVITPIGIIVRLVRRNPLSPPESGGSYWVASASEADRRGTMERQF